MRIPAALVIAALLVRAQDQPPAPQPLITPPATQAQVPPPANMVLNLPNASLTEVIDMLARTLKMNYILDPRVKTGTVTMQTYGEIKGVDVKSLLELILRLNSAAMVQVGDIYRIVPLSDVSRTPVPLSRETSPSAIPEDDRVMLNLIFVKYVQASELMKLVEPFLGDGGKATVYEPANMVILQDSARSMRRTMELVALFDSDALARQRVRLFELKNGRPSELVKDLEAILKGVSLTEKSASVRFMPIDRLNTLIAVAPNPGIFTEVEKWLEKLDIPAKASVGATQNFAYRVKYGDAMVLSIAVQALYTGNPFLISMLGQMQQFQQMSRQAGGGGMGGMGMMGNMGMMGGGMMGGGMMGGMGMMPGMGMMGGGMFPGMGMMGMMPGMMGMPGMGMMGGLYGGYGMPGYGAPQPGASPTVGGPLAGQQNQAGNYLGATPGGMFGGQQQTPRIVPNPFDNTLLIQGSEQEYASLLKLLEKLDIPPRQVLIEAKIYEVSLTGAFSAGVQSYLQRRNSTGGVRQLLGSAPGQGLQLTAGWLISQSREILGVLNMQENIGRSKVIAHPAVIATDNMTASISVGTDVPTLSSQAVSPIQQGGTSLFTNQIQNRSTGINFTITPRILPSGIVSLDINQDVTAPVPPPAGVSANINSPSFSRRNVTTSITLQDGDTIAIGGIIQESDASSSAGIPGLHRIPYLGFVFGGKSVTKSRTELVVFITPRVIYDTTDVADASEEVRSRLKRLNKIIRE